MASRLFLLRVIFIFSLFICTSAQAEGAAGEAAGEASKPHSRDVAGVQVPARFALEGVAKPLLLNGAGVRYKFFFKVYAAALYLPELEHKPEAILSDPPANRVLMHFLYDEVAREKLVDAWVSGFENNTDEQQLQSIKADLEQFNRWFPTLKSGDVVLLDYIPGTGTRVTIKGAIKGVIPGKAFNRALLSVWLGEDPVTEDLKQALLGVEELED